MNNEETELVLHAEDEEVDQLCTEDTIQCTGILCGNLKFAKKSILKRHWLDNHLPYSNIYMYALMTSAHTLAHGRRTHKTF